MAQRHNMLHMATAMMLQIIINIYIEKGKVQNGQNIKINIYIYIIRLKQCQKEILLVLVDQRSMVF